MRILLTGASSFTGLAFAEALAAAGHELVCPLRRPMELYEGIRKQRVERLRKIVPNLPIASFGSEPFLKVIREEQPCDLLCHHAADVTNYKSPDFDPLRALENNTANLRNVLKAFQSRGGKAVVLTGTVFEPDEGASEESDGNTMPLPAVSPYGLSKGLTWQVFRYYCETAGIPLGKFVIPNPFGPWEEPRFTAYLMNTWKEGKTAKVQTPDYVRDNIHAELLAEVYQAFVEKAVRGEALKINPSGYVESQRAFAERVAREVRPRIGWACGLEFAVQKDFSEPKTRFNTEPAAKLVSGWDERAAWDRFVEFYTRP